MTWVMYSDNPNGTRTAPGGVGLGTIDVIQVVRTAANKSIYIYMFNNASLLPGVISSSISRGRAGRRNAELGGTGCIIGTAVSGVTLPGPNKGKDPPHSSRYPVKGYIY